MKIFKYFLRFLLFAIIGLLIAAVVIPVVFKDDILEGVKNAVNDNVNAKVDFADVDLTIISSFPNAGIEISGISIEGVEEFESVKLADIEQLVLEVSIPSLFDKSKALEVRKVVVDKPNLNILVKKNGKANYDIMKATETESSGGDFVMKLQSYEINDGSVKYVDRLGKQEAVINGLQHSGSGDFYNEQFDLDTKTTIADLTYISEGSKFLSHATAAADAKFAVDMATSKYTLKENKLKVNAMDVNVDGYVQLLEDAILMDMKFDAPGEDAKGIMSILPGVYSKEFAAAKVAGTASFNGSVKGKFVSEKGIFPALNLAAKISNGSMQYPSLNKDISNINVDLAVSAKQGNYDDMVVNIPALAVRVGDNDLTGRLTTTNLSSDPSIDGMLKGKVNLADWKAALPLEGVEQLEGVLEADMTFAGKQSDVVSENYKALKFEGTAKGANVTYKAVDQPLINIGSITSTLSPAQITLASESVKAGKTDATATVLVENPLAYLVGEGKMTTKLKVNSKLVDANEWMTTASATEEERLQIPSEIANVELDLKADKVLFTEYEIKDMTIKGQHGDNDMAVEEFSGKIGSSDFSLSGNVDNTLGYFNNDEVLTGNLKLQSQKMVMNDFMQSDPAAASSEIVPVPENIDVTIVSEVATAQYDKITLRELKGDIVVKDRKAELRDGQSKGLGGLMKFAGLYGTPVGEKPDFSFKYDLSNLDFGQTFASVDFAQSLAPIMNYINGQFNSTLVMEGKLDDNMFPDLATLDASGFLETISGTLGKIDVADKLADKLGINELRRLSLDHTKNWFEIVDGMVEIKPFTKEIAGIEMSMNGRHGLGQDMSYQITMDIPRELLKKNIVTGALDKGLSLLEQQASKLGVNLDQGDYIKIRVDLTGAMKSPGIKITPLGSGGKSTGNIVQNEIDNLKNTVKDSVNTVIKETTKKVKDTVDATIKTAKDSVKTVINKKVETAADSAKKVADKVVKDQLDKVLKDSAAQDVKNKAEEVIKDATGGSVDDVKDKIKDWNPFKKKKNK